MKASLISYSQAVPATDQNALFENNPDLLDLVAYCARVSNPSNQNNTATNEKLVNYLVKHKHWSPLEMVSVCMEVETTRDIARQFLRHRSFSFQEFSQRYADPTKDLSFVTREARLQDPKNRQNSIPLDLDDMGKGGEGSSMTKEELLARGWYDKQRAVIDAAREAYTWAIQNGIAKEQARAVLPEGNTMSRMYVNGTLRSWVHYVELRSANGTQKEHMDIANACAKVIAEIFPLINDYVGKDIA
jgi:thymidylate synthase (FAD)